MNWTAIVVIALTNLSVITDDDVSTVEGYWLSEKKEYVVQIFQQEQELKGTVVWLANPLDRFGEPRRDVLNKESELRSRLIIGMNVLYGLEIDDGVWKNGKIYDFDSGQEYNARLQLDELDKLRVTGFYELLFFLGKTKEWIRVDDLSKYGLE